jgi:CheY-like chemotaxis protein
MYFRPGQPAGQGDRQHAGTAAEIDDRSGIVRHPNGQIEQALGLRPRNQHPGVDDHVEVGERRRALEILERLTFETAASKFLRVALRRLEAAPLVGRQARKQVVHAQMLPECGPMARILVADDSPTVRLLVRRHLEADGHDVVEASDGAAAYDTGVAEQFDLAILDQLMPGMLGLDVLHRWRKEGHDLPVILLSAVDDDITVVRSLELGAMDYVRKPFSVPELKARIAMRLQG